MGQNNPEPENDGIEMKKRTTQSHKTYKHKSKNYQRRWRREEISAVNPKNRPTKDAKLHSRDTQPMKN